MKISVTKAIVGRTGLISALAISCLVAGVVGPVMSARAQADGFADPAFKTVWERTDVLVAQGTVSRTWVWGPTKHGTAWTTW